MKIKNIVLFVLFITFIANTCTTKHSRITEIKNGIQLETQTVNLRIQFHSNKMARIIKWPVNGTPEKSSLVVIHDSLPELDINIKYEGENIIVSSNKLKLRIISKNCKIDYFDVEDHPVLSEKRTEFTPVVYEDDPAFQIKQSFSLTADEGIYGLGQHQYGYMNYRGKTVKLVQTNTDAVTPFLISTQGYGILWDNYSKTIFEDNKKELSLWSDVADNIDYYFIYGEKMDSVIAGYRNITGQAPMYGKWAYGYWQSKEHYDTRDELLSIATEYRQRKIPIDNIIQDWDYWNGAENWSGMFFDETLFPKPKEMINKLHSMNFHLIISIWPALGPNTPIYKDMFRKGYLYETVGWGGFRYYDAFNPDANHLYFKYLNKGIISNGIDGLWIDSTEPDVRNATTKESTEYEMKKVGRNYLGTWARYLNAFSLSMTDAIYNNLRNETDQKRAYILTRSTFAGQQRNAATTWSGDIGASWEIYKKQIAAGINHSMSGIPYWTFDIGAFVIGAYEGVFSTGGKNPAYQELYCRMFQFGTFCPVFRSHGSETPREIWEFGDFTEPMIQFDNLRYRLLPYIYSSAWKITSEGYTIMRGLPMDFSNDEKTFNLNDQFMFGQSIMVCPVTEYMIYRPPEKSVFVESKYFKTKDGKQGLNAYYYNDPEYKNLTHEQTERDINLLWYTGRPEYVTDSMYAIRFEGKLIPDQTGKHQFHLKCYDAKRIYINGKKLEMIYTSVEQYTEYIDLEAGKEYDFKMEVENRSTGAAKTILFWKTPEIFAKEQLVEKRKKTRPVYLPADTKWIDFWTGITFNGGQEIIADAPLDIIPLYIKAGSIIPMGPFIQYSDEKPANPIELRIYPGTDGNFTLYEDENDNYNYEKGIYSTIDFHWNDVDKLLTISGRKGEFPGMLNDRIFNVILVKENTGTGLYPSQTHDKSILYQGNELTVEIN